MKGSKKGEPIFRLDAIWKTYPAPPGVEGLSVLRGVDMTMAAGESAAVMGPSGSGKSTLLNIIGTLDKPTRGTVVHGEMDINSLSETERAHLRNRRIGFVFQLHHLLPQFTVLENILLPVYPALKESGTPKEDQEKAVARAQELLTRIGLSGKGARYPWSLSGGERQRVAVARALINSPPLLLADEPTGSLDSESAGALMELLMEMNREEDVALVLVTHAEPLARCMTKGYELSGGMLR